MNSVVGICNSALVKIGADLISSLDDNVKSARLCKEQFEKLRDEVLRAHPWNFSKVRAQLGQTSPAPLFDFEFAYLLPQDCLKVLKTQDPYIVWKVEGRLLLSCEDTIQIQYTQRVTDPTQWDSDFCEALACRIGADIAYAITQSAQVQTNLWNAYQDRLKLARSMNAQEGTPDPVLAEDWLIRRF